MRKMPGIRAACKTRSGMTSSSGKHHSGRIEKARAAGRAKRKSARRVASLKKSWGHEY